MDADDASPVAYAHAVPPPWPRACRFDTVYLDADLRISKDSRGDTLVTTRAGPPRVFR